MTTIVGLLRATLQNVLESPIFQIEMSNLHQTIPTSDHTFDHEKLVIKLA